MSVATQDKVGLALSLDDAAALTPFSAKTLRKAIHATDPKAWPPPLRAKVGSRNTNGTPRSYVVLTQDLSAWLEALPDA